MSTLYDYKCSGCRNIEEKNHKMTELPKYFCSKCGSRMEKIISAASFRLNGPDWYKSGFSAKK